jgi:hypothetical protein
MVRWWRGFARFAQRITIGTRTHLESMYGTDDAPRRAMVSLIGGFFILFGAISLCGDREGLDASLTNRGLDDRTRTVSA